MELREGEKGKENDQAIPQDVKVEDIRMCTERCQKMGVGGKGVRESILRY
jgi:hypothetical protein